MLGNHAPNISRFITPSKTIAMKIRTVLTTVGPILRPAAVKNIEVATHNIEVAIPAAWPRMESGIISIIKSIFMFVLFTTITKTALTSILPRFAE